MKRVAGLLAVWLLLFSCAPEQTELPPLEPAPTYDSPAQPPAEEDDIQIEQNTALPPSPYSWTARADLKSVVTEEPALAVERVECSPDGIFIIASTGRVLQPPATFAGQGDTEVTIVREDLLAANIYVGASGSLDDREVVEASVDPTHYWCIPKREVCYQWIEFGDFGLALRKDRAARVSSGKIYNLRLGIVTALQRSAIDHCLPEYDGG